MKPKRALISVWDKTGVVEFAKELAFLKIEILATGKTAKTLKDAGIKVIEVSDWTKSPEVLGGRVKTLHPKIAAGILSYRKEPDIEPIDIVVCNLYPFESFLVDKLTIEELTSELGLTEYQVKRIRPIMKEESLRRSGLIKKYANGGPAGRQELQKELKLFREYYEDMYSHVFSDAQFGQYKRLRDAHSPGEK